MRSILGSLLVSLLAAAPLSAAVLLPGSILVLGGDRLLLIDPGRRSPEIVSSTLVGGGEPWRRLHDFDLAPDGFLYATVLFSDVVLRIDPTTGDRTILSSNTRGSGPGLVSPQALEITRDGTLHVTDRQRGASSDYIHRIVRVDTVSGDRTIEVEQALSGINFTTTDMRELSDGRLLISTFDGSNSTFIYVADRATGTFRRFGQALPGGNLNLALLEGTPLKFVVSDTPFGMRLLEASTTPSQPGPTRTIDGCDDPGTNFARVPRGVEVDTDRLLIVSASGHEKNCTGDEGLQRLAGHLYRVDPVTGDSTLLYVSEPILDEADFDDVVVVPEDFPFDDTDSDGIADVVDNCVFDVNPGQSDFDQDGVGDACNDAEDPDADEIADALDVCPDHADPFQDDGDGDGIGDVCDPFPGDPNNAAAALEVDLAGVSEELARCRDRLPMDSDGDGVDDPGDLCADTPLDESIDSDGCSLEQFCARFDPTPSWSASFRCSLADWRDDEGRAPRDCRVHRESCVAGVGTR